MGAVVATERYEQGRTEPKSRCARHPIAALILEPSDRDRFRQSVLSQVTVRFCRRRHELRSLATRLLSAVVVEAQDETGAPLAPVVRELKRGIPSLSILAYVDFTAEHAGEIKALTRAGVDDFILRGRDDCQTILSSISRATTRAAAARALDVLSPIVGESLAPFLRYCLDHADESPTVEAAAGALGIHRKTLAHRAASVSMPKPRALLVWCRLLVAARMLEDPERTVEQIALTLRFGTASAFRNVCRRYTGLRPPEVRELGGFEVILDACKRALVASHGAESILAERTVTVSRG